MNAEVVKAMNREPRKACKFKKWWDKNSYKVIRVILFPLWFCVLLKEKVVMPLLKKFDSKYNMWSDERAQEIFNYYIPRYSWWSAEDKAFHFYDNGYGWYFRCAKKHLKWKDRRFWRAHAGWRGSDMREYLIQKFELNGFKKVIVSTYDGVTEILFEMEEEKEIEKC